MAPAVDPDWPLNRYQFMPHAVMLEDLDGRSGWRAAADVALDGELL
ncbi:MAG: hypothetical protein OEZ14_02515 [Acidimicrobiia bacterium]|nr:hypothetical protein [Acidimicrobiia bacterium]